MAIHLNGIRIDLVAIDHTRQNALAAQLFNLLAGNGAFSILIVISS